MANQKEFLSEFSLPTYDEWKQAAIDALKGAPFEKKLITPTYEGVDLQPIYNEADRDKVSYLADSLPGKFPFVRGVCSAGYKSGSWDVAQSITYPLPTDFNKALLADLACGQNAVSIKLCSCRTMFADIYKQRPEWEDFICSSVHIADLEDIEQAFRDVDLTKISINFLPTCPVSYTFEVASLFLAYCKKYNINLGDLRVNFGFDFLTSLVKNGELETVRPDIALDEMASLIGILSEKSTNSSSISIDGSAYHNFGASAVQGIAYSVATGVYYIKELLTRGLEINNIARNIHFNFSSGVKFFTEISKLRAARVIWAKIIKEFGGDSDSQRMKIHAFTSKVYETKFDPYVNILRGTTEGLSAILAGVNSLHISPFDEELGTGGEFSRRVARNIQSILKDESHILDTIDPAGGSYYIETLTDQFVVEIWKIFREIEKSGGMLAALRSGFIKSSISEVVSKRKENIAFRKDVLLGTNKYPNLMEKPVDTLQPQDISSIKNHIDSGIARKKTVDTKPIYDALVSKKYDEAINLSIDAFVAGASITDIWASKSKEKNTISEIPRFRAAKLFEDLRNASNEFKTKTGKAPELYFANFGTLKQYKGRADFATDFFAVAGFEINQGTGYLTADEGIADITNITAPAIVICSTDEIYPEVVPAFVAALKKTKPAVKIILAGLPKDHVDAFKAAGVDEFIHIKSNVYETLLGLMKNIGVIA